MPTNYDLWKTTAPSPGGGGFNTRTQVACKRGHTWLVHDPKHFICWICAALDYEKRKKEKVA